MAKRRRRKIVRARTATRSFKRAKKRSTRSKTNGALMLALGAGVYGAGREYLSGLLQPVTARLPFGDYADEATMLGASYLLMKGKVPLINKVKISRDIGRAGFVIESARIGAGLMAGKFGMSTTSNTSRNGVVYL